MMKILQLLLLIFCGCRFCSSSRLYEDPIGQEQTTTDFSESTIYKEMTSTTTPNLYETSKSHDEILLHIYANEVTKQNYSRANTSKQNYSRANTSKQNYSLADASNLELDSVKLDHFYDIDTVDEPFGTVNQFSSSVNQVNNSFTKRNGHIDGESISIYKYDETLDEELRYHFGGNISDDNNELVKRENVLFDTYTIDKIKRAKIEEIKFNSEILKEKFGIINYKSKVLICSSTNDGRIEIVILSNLLERENQIFISGSGPCQFVLYGDDVLLLNVDNTESKSLIISKIILKEGKAKELQVIRDFSGQLVDIYAWQQNNTPYFALKLYQSNVASHKTKFSIYAMENGRFALVQNLQWFISGDFHFFQIGRLGFIAITNYIENERMDQPSTGLFQYSVYQKKYVLFQRFTIFKVSSVTSVSTESFEVYLILTSYCKEEHEFCNPNTLSALYKYNGATFVPFQHIETTGAMKSLFVKHKEEIFVLISSPLKDISVYQLGNKKFVEIFPELGSEILLEGHSDMFDMKINGESLIGFKSIDDSRYSWVLFRLNFDAAKTNSYTAISDWCHMALEILNAKFEQVENKIKEKGFKSLANVRNEYETPTQEYSNHIFSEVYKDFNSRTNKAVENIKVLEKNLKDVEKIISEAINIDETTDWPDNLHISSIAIAAAKVNGLFAEYLNDQRVPSVDELIPLNNESLTLELYTKTFSNIEFQRNLYVDNLNNQPLSSYVTLNGNHAMKGHIIFKQLSTPKIDVGGLIDGIKINNETVLLQDGSEIFKGSLKCKSIYISNLETSYINEIDIKELMRSTFAQNSSNIIKGDINIYGDLIYPGDLKIGTLFGRSTKFFEDEILYLNSGRPQLINGHYTIKNIKADNIEVGKTVNNVPFPDSVFVNLPVKIYHIAKARFDSVVATQVHVDIGVNEIKVLDGELDLITLNEDQIVIGQKSFGGMHLKNYIILRNRTALDLTQKYSSAFGDSQNLDKELQFYQTTAKLRESLKNENELLISFIGVRTTLMKLIDTKPTTVYQSSLPYDDATYPDISNTVTMVTSGLTSLNEALMKKNYIGIAEKFDISERDIRQLNSLSRFKTLPYYLLNTVSSFYSSLDEVYNRVEIIIRDKRTIITTLKENVNAFDKKIREEISKHNANDFGSKGSFVKYLISGYDFRNISLTLRRKGFKSLIDETEIVNKIKHADWVIFRNGLNTPHINTINMERLLEQSVPFSSNVTNLNLVFEESVVIQKNVKTPYINEDITSKFAKLTEDNVFKKEVEFLDLRFFADVEVKGNVNNLKLKEFASRIARTNEYQKFAIPISFRSVTAEIINASVVTLNNVPFKDYVLKSEENVFILGKKQFGNVSVLNSFVTIKNLHTEELNKIDLAESIESKRKVEKDIILDSEKAFKKLVIKGNINIPRYIRSNDNFSHLNMSRLYEDAVRYDRRETIFGSLILKGNVQAEKLTYTSEFDGISAKTFEKGFVLQNEDQTLHETNSFNNLRVKNLSIRSNLLQGINFSRLVNEAAKIDEDHEFHERIFFGNITSRNSVEVNGLVQGWNLTKDAVLDTDAAVITGIKTFQAPVTTESDIVVHGLVNNMNLGKKCKAITGEVEIRGPIRFEKDIKVDRIEIGSHTIPNNYTTFWVNNNPTVLNAEIVFEKIESEGIQILDELNGENIKTILEGPIPLNCHEGVKLKNLTVNTLISGNLTAREIRVKTLDGENSTILDNLVINDHDQSFTTDLRITDLEVSGQLSLGNTINGFMMSDFCVKGLPCQLESHKTFLNHVIVLKNWDIENESRLNNITIEDMKTSSFSHTRIVIVKGSVYAPAVTVERSVNGILFNEDTIMTRSTQQTINGAFIFSNNGKLSFEAKEVTVLSQLFNKVNISSLEPYQLKNYENDNNDDSNLKELLEKFENLTYKVIQVNALLRDQPIRFAGWEPVSTFSAGNIIPLEEGIGSRVFFVALVSNNGIHLKHYIPHTMIYKDYVYLKVNCTTDVKGFFMKDELFISASVNCENPNIDLNGTLLVSPDSFSLNQNVYSYLWKITSRSPMLYAAIATGKADQILSLKISGRNCMLFISRDAPRQNILCEDKKSLLLQQNLELRRVIKALHFDFESSVGSRALLVIGSEELLNQIPIITVLEYNGKSNHYETIQRIQADRLIWLSSLNFGKNLYVASVHKPFTGSVSGHVNIYRLEEIWLNETYNSASRFILEESIYLADPLQATLLQSPSDQIFLLVLNKNEFIMRYVKKGYGKFKLEGSIHVPGAKTLSSWVWKRINSYNVAVSVGENCLEPSSNNSQVIVFKPLFEGWKKSFDGNR